MPRENLLNYPLKNLFNYPLKSLINHIKTSPTGLVNSSLFIYVWIGKAYHTFNRFKTFTMKWCYALLL